MGSSWAGGAGWARHSCMITPRTVLFCFALYPRPIPPSSRRAQDIQLPSIRTCSSSSWFSSLVLLCVFRLLSLLQFRARASATSSIMSTQDPPTSLRDMTRDDWDRFRERIRCWYVSEGKTMAEILKELKAHQFAVKYVPDSYVVGRACVT
jgi:hypothetical protein